MDMPFALVPEGQPIADTVLRLVDTDIDSLLRDADSAQYVRKSQRKAVKRVAA